MIEQVDAARPSADDEPHSRLRALPGRGPVASVIESRVPVPKTGLVGRARELAALRALIACPENRLITLTGPGGAGKTRLATQLAIDLDHRFDGAVAFVELASFRDPDLVVTAIGQTLGIPNSGDGSLLDRVIDRLDNRFLLILDNFEHVIAAAPVISELITACPRLTVVVTSREVLRLYGEHEIAIPPLGLPENTGDLAALAEAEAVALFVERAQAVRLGFALDEGNAAAVAAICARLDGQPLAIELAAARMRHLSPQALWTRFASSLALLTQGSRDLPPRLQTMRNAIAWSHDLLTPAEQRLFQRLAVFHGGFTLAAAERIASDGEADIHGLLPVDAIFEGIASLVDKSLLVAPSDPSREPRYHMLETIREFGLERLDSSDDGGVARRCLAIWCLDLAEQAAANANGPDRAALARQIEQEHANFRQSLLWAETTGNAEVALRLVAALAPFWEMHGNLREGEEWSRRCLAIPAPETSPALGPALRGAAAIAYRRGHYDDAIGYAERAFALAERDGDDRLRAAVLLVLGNVDFDRGDLTSCLARYRAAAHAYRAAGDEDGYADARAKQGLVLTNLDELDEAAAALDEAVAIGRRLHRPIWTAIATGRLAFVDQRRGELAAAEQRVVAVIPVLHELNPISAVAMLWLGATIARDSGDHALAAERFRASLELRWRWGERRGVAEGVAGIAELAILTDQTDEGVRLYGGLDAMRQIVGAPGYRSEQACRDRALAAARRKLGHAAFDRLTAEGLGMTRAETVALALVLAERIHGMDSKAASGGAGPALDPAIASITAREMEVLHFAAMGLSDREIGEALFISPRTVARHLHSIYQKIDVNSRAAATAYAHRHGLLTLPDA